LNGTIRLLTISILLMPLVVLLSQTGCTKQEEKKEPERVINVKTQKAEKRSVKPFIEGVGTLNAYEEVVVSSEVEGILKELKADNGTPVTKGMLLATVDDTDFSLEVRRADAALKQSEATLANTKLEYQRKEALHKEELLTSQQFDDVKTRLVLAEAEVDRARAFLSLTKQRLSKTMIYSPLSGVVKDKKVERGNFVKNGTHLFTVIQNNPIKLNFSVPEKDIGKLKVGQEVAFTVEALPGREFKGKVTIVYPSLEAQTRTLQVEAQVPNTDGLLKPGLFAQVTHYTGPPHDAIIVPVIAPIYEREIVRVYVIEGDRAKERRVALGTKYGEFIEVLEGVKEGDAVVTVGQQNLSDGVKVNIQAEAAAPAKD
jgi:membrane fusion protein (multidrug efflux system)